MSAQPNPLVDVTEDDLEQAIRAGRATVARLRLQLRTLEIAVADVPEAPPGDDQQAALRAATELCRTVIEPRLASRRAELEIELAQVRDQAAELVTRARAEADARIAEARAQLLAVIVSPYDEDTVPPTDEGPAAHLEPTTRPDRTPRFRPVAWDEAGVGGKGEADVEAAAPRPRRAGPVVRLVEPEPVVEPESAWDDDPETDDEPGPDPKPATPAEQAAPRRQAMVAAAAPRAVPTWRVFVAVDVLLPMFVALVVIVVLLAWFG